MYPYVGMYVDEWRPDLARGWISSDFLTDGTIGGRKDKAVELKSVVVRLANLNNLRPRPIWPDRVAVGWG